MCKSRWVKVRRTCVCVCVCVRVCARACVRHHFLTGLLLSSYTTRGTALAKRAFHLNTPSSAASDRMNTSAWSLVEQKNMLFNKIPPKRTTPNPWVDVINELCCALKLRLANLHALVVTKRRGTEKADAVYCWNERGECCTGDTKTDYRWREEARKLLHEAKSRFRSGDGGLTWAPLCESPRAGPRPHRPGGTCSMRSTRYQSWRRALGPGNLRESSLLCWGEVARRARERERREVTTNRATALSK